MLTTMSLNIDLNESERTQLIELIHEVLHVRTRFELFLWLQGQLQRFLPHDVLISAWGDFSQEAIPFDIISPLPGISTSAPCQAALTPFLKQLFGDWEHHGHAPFSLTIEHGILHAHALDLCINEASFSRMQHGVVHVIQDHRGRQNALFFLLNATEPYGRAARNLLATLAPYIDLALRMTQGSNTLPPVAEPLQPAETDSPLSPRELEIMEWVTRGKTNIEIGMILDISAYTVKNHLRHIFRKLDVMNRAQAVSKHRQSFELH